jgi:hypothetical protein
MPDFLNAENTASLSSASFTPEQDLHFVLCDFGRFGQAYVEKDPMEADAFEPRTPPSTGQYDRPPSFCTTETDRCSRDCAAVDIQVIGRKAHPPTSLNGWVGCQNEAVCESSCLPDNLGFPRMQAVSVEAQDRPHPIRRQINGGPHQQVLCGPQEKRKNRCRAHDREELKHNVRAFQPAGHRIEQHFKLDFGCRCARGPVKTRGRNTLGIKAVTLRGRERLRIHMISLQKAVCGRTLNPVQ